MKPPIERRVVPSVALDDLSPRQVPRRFRALLDEGAELCVVGDAKRDPERLLRDGYVPRHTFELFGTRFFVTHPLQNPSVRFAVAYVVPQPSRGGRVRAYARIFYKDVALHWRVGSHRTGAGDTLWVGKGALQTVGTGASAQQWTNESTTDLPIELEQALETVNRSVKRVQTDTVALELVLRRGSDEHIAPFRDFLAPRERAARDRRNLVYGGKRIARFTRKNDPTSLRFVRGFEPDLDDGVFETSALSSAIYGGEVKRFRVLSTNRKIQYLFYAAMGGLRQVWIIPPQATTTELSSFGARTVDVAIDEDLCIPGYEFHHFDPEVDPSEHFTQIPEGLAGAASEGDPSRADASAWLDKMPIVAAFRRKVLGERGT